MKTRFSAEGFVELSLDGLKGQYLIQYLVRR